MKKAKAVKVEKTIDLAKIFDLFLLSSPIQRLENEYDRERLLVRLRE
jgi:hypothetical protein